MESAAFRGQGRVSLMCLENGYPQHCEERGSSIGTAKINFLLFCCFVSPQMDIRCKIVPGNASGSLSKRSISSKYPNKPTHFHRGAPSFLMMERGLTDFRPVKSAGLGSRLGSDHACTHGPSDPAQVTSPLSSSLLICKQSRSASSWACHEPAHGVF